MVEAVNDILTDLTEGLTPPANGQLTTERIFSDEHFGLTFGVDVEVDSGAGITASLGTSFDIEYNDIRKRFVTKFTQRYYDVSIDVPENPSDFYSSFPTLNGNMTPVYVGSMKYGRTLFFDMTSRDSRFAIQTAISAALESSRCGDDAPEPEPEPDMMMTMMDGMMPAADGMDDGMGMGGEGEMMDGEEEMMEDEIPEGPCGGATELGVAFMSEFSSEYSQTFEESTVRVTTIGGAPNRRYRH